MNGVLVNVSTQIVGSELSQNYTDGLELYVDDISIFGDEGVLQIGTIWSEDRETVPYITITHTDEFDEPYLELGLELVNDYVVDENVVQIYPLVEVKMATAYLPGSGDIEVPLSSGVWQLVEDGTRDENEGEIVVIQNGMVTSLYGTPPSISGDYIAFIEAGKISAGVLDANVVTIASQDNNTIIDSNGIKVTNASDPDSYVKLDANAANDKLLVISKGALEIKDADESIIIDKDGIVADGIIRGILPGSNNPITNSSFERLVAGTTKPTNWTRAGSSPDNIDAIVSSNPRYGTRTFYCYHPTATDAKATQTIEVQPNTDYALSFYYKSDKLGSDPMFGSGIEYGDGTLWGEGSASGGGDRGAEIRVLDGATPLISSGIVWGTHQVWEREITTTFNTGSATSLDIEVAIGTATSPTVGKFWLDAISLQEGAVIQPWNLSINDFLDYGSIAYPVGSIYFNATYATNPNTLLGFGTWELFGTGKMLVGLDSGDGDFDTLEETGGVKTHPLSEAELASHGHVQNSHNHTQNSHNHIQNSHNHSNSAHTHTAVIYTGNSEYLSMNSGGSQYEMSWTDNTGLTNDIRPSQAGITIDGEVPTNQAETATNQGEVAVNQTTGSGTAHQNLPPYIVVYMWKRTA